MSAGGGLGAVETGGRLLDGEEHPVIAVNEQGSSDILLICEHAGRAIPRALAQLGLPESEISRHIGWDIGAEGVARRLSELLDAPLLMQRYSRLVYDCNRPPEAPSAMPLVSETTHISGNRDLSAADRLDRIRSIYRPFHDAVSQLLDRRAAEQRRTIFVTIHSFTPVYKGVKRTLDVGLLHDRDSRFIDQLYRLFGRYRELTARRNEPYGPEDGVLHTINLHAGMRGLLNAMIEIRNDHIADAQGQETWARRLAGVIAEAADPRELRAAASG